jgi:hypothetical protein
MDVNTQERPLSNSTISQWQEAKKALDYWKAKEMELRKALAAEQFGANESVGTHKKDLDESTVIKLTVKETITLSKDLDLLSKVGAELVTAGMDHDLIKGVIKWEASLIEGAYKKLPEKFKAIVNQALTIKPSAPSIDIVAKKEG